MTLNSSEVPKILSFKGLNAQGSNCLTPPELGHAIIICSRRPTANSAFMRLTVELNI